MKSLIILANPNSESSATFIAQTYSDLQTKKWNQIEIMDLYKSQQIPYLDTTLTTKPAVVEFYQNKVKEADEIVFVFPVRRGDAPAILKNRFDNVMSTWFAYVYKNGRPVWLLEKKAKMFITCDGPKIFFSLFPISIKYFWKFMRLGFCWIKMTNFILFDRMRSKKKNPDWKENILSKIQNTENSI